MNNIFFIFFFTEFHDNSVAVLEWRKQDMCESCFLMWYQKWRTFCELWREHTNNRQLLPYRRYLNFKLESTEKWWTWRNHNLNLRPWSDFYWVRMKRFNFFSCEVCQVFFRQINGIHLYYFQLFRTILLGATKRIQTSLANWVTHNAPM